VEAEIHGEFLPGAVGELPAAGLVRVVVADEDYARAREVIGRWEASGASDPTPEVSKRSPSQFLAALAGLAVGIAGTYAYFRTPVSHDGIDYNRDGVLDTRWTKSPNGVLAVSKTDRNFDGKPDYIEHFDENGNISTAEADDNFDGAYETRYRFSLGDFEYGEVDTDGDKLPNIVWRFKHGVLSSGEYINPYSGNPFRIEYYEFGTTVRAEIDINGDGKLDRHLFYSPAAEIVRTEPIEPAP
ncbi:MAG: DUF2007 domain-containing protein, partial [Burkholderiales bacterium]